MNAPVERTLKADDTTTPAKIWIPDIDAEAGIGPLPGISVYPPRQIVMAGTRDVFIVNRDTRAAIEALLDFYEAIDLPHIPKDNVVYLRYRGKTLDSAVRDNRKNVRRVIRQLGLQKTTVTPFITTALTLQAAEYFRATTDVQSRQVIERANNKALLLQAAKERGFTCHEGTLVHDIPDARTTVERLFQKHKLVCVKEVRAASGLGVHKATHAKEAMMLVARILKTKSRKGVLIEPWLEMDKTRGCPSVQIEVGDSAAEDTVFTATKQILGGSDGTTHLGNINAPEILEYQKVQTQVRKVLAWLRDIGFRGIAGIDLFAEAGSPADEYLIGEVNARHTGVTAAMFAVNKCRGDIKDVAWAVHNNIKVKNTLTPEECLAHLKKKGLIYKPDTKTGFLPTNFAALPYGKLMGVVIANDDAQRDQILTQVTLAFAA